MLLNEDVGNAARNGKVWLYDPITDELVKIARHDTARFGDIGIPATLPFNQDEETSGILDASSILGPGAYLMVDQSHYQINASSNVEQFSNPTELVEGGQLLFVRAPLATNKDMCKSSGYGDYRRADGTAFKTQGDCIQYVNTGK